MESIGLERKRELTLLPDMFADGLVDGLLQRSDEYSKERSKNRRDQLHDQEMLFTIFLRNSVEIGDYSTTSTAKYDRKWLG